MKMKKLVRLAGMLSLGWAVTIVVKLLISALVALAVLWAACLAGVVLKIELPYRAITVLTALSVLAALVVLDVIKHCRTKHRTR
jgi:uncharacterized Tic20 family protein